MQWLCVLAVHGLQDVLLLAVAAGLAEGRLVGVGRAGVRGRDVRVCVGRLGGDWGAAGRTKYLWVWCLPTPLGPFQLYQGQQHGMELMGFELKCTRYHCLQMRVSIRAVVLIWMINAMCRSWGLTSNARLTIACVSVLMRE